MNFQKQKWKKKQEVDKDLRKFNVNETWGKSLGNSPVLRAH